MKTDALLNAADAGTDNSTGSIRESIRDAIIDRRLAPGTKLSEADVGALFNVSRTLVREALQGLAYEGLVRVEKNRGAFVAYPSPEEARQIFDTRRLMEPGVLKEAGRRIGTQEILELKALLEEEGRLTGERGRAARRAEIKASGDFHLALAAYTGNAVLQRFMEELVARSSLVIALYGQSAISSCGHHEHQDIVAAIEKSDLDQACRLMIEHIDHIETDLDLIHRKPSDLKDALGL